MGTRRKLGAMLSEKALRGWGDWADRHGVSIAALLEAIGLSLAEEEDNPSVRSTIERAKDIQRQRRKRSYDR